MTFSTESFYGTPTRPITAKENRLNCSQMYWKSPNKKMSYGNLYLIYNPFNINYSFQN